MFVESGANSDARERVVRALQDFGVEIADAAPLAIYVGGRASRLPSPIESDPRRRMILRVRRAASNRPDARPVFDWPHEVTLELALWLLADRPPQPLNLDVTVPESPHSGVPRLLMGLTDSRRIDIALQGPANAALADETRAWAERMISTMASRWDMAGSSCDCCT